MAEVQQNDSGGGKKGRQKKMTIRVDFTPMVDMNMLLITFFMLCTTMIKSQTLNIALPSNEKVQDETQMNQAAEDQAVTIIIDAKRIAGKPDVVDTIGGIKPVIYYYFGKAGGVDGIGADGIIKVNNLEMTELAANTGVPGKPIYNGIRKIIREKNKLVVEAIDKERGKFQREGHEMTDEELAQFNEAAKKIRRDEKLNPPVVIIKATPKAPYGALVAILDEMQINNIAKYQIDNMSHEDTLLMLDYAKTHPVK